MRSRISAALLASQLALAGCGAVGEIDDDGGAVDADVSAVDAEMQPEDAMRSDDALDAQTGADRLDVSVDAPRDATDATRTDAPRDGMITDAPRDVTAMDAARDVVTRDVVMDGGCPQEMTLVEGRVCVDRWEGALEAVAMDGGVTPWSPYENPGSRSVRAVSRSGQVPQGYITGEQAQRACEAAGKRLCALDEWLRACRGPMNRVYPYGDAYVRRRCNEARTPHPVVQFFGTSMNVFTFTNMNNPGINMQPDTVARTGAFDGCESPWGAFDMVGNLHEWIADTAGTFKGGFYVDAEINGRGCLYTTTAHAFSYRDYSTGFRCCANPR